MATTLHHRGTYDTTIMTPSPVFQTSGHVARFVDGMVKDRKTGDGVQVDHLVKSVLKACFVGEKRVEWPRFRTTDR